MFESVDPERHFLRLPDPKAEAIYLIPFRLVGHGPKIFSCRLEGRELGERDCILIEGSMGKVEI